MYVERSILRFDEKIAQTFKNFVEDMNEKRKRRIKKYLKNTSMNCYHYLVDEGIDWRSRLIWIVLHLIVFFMIISMIWIALGTSTSTFTTRMPADAPISMMPFPGIALCSVNKMSRYKTSVFAKELISKGLSNRNESELVHLLSFMGYAYDFEETEGDILDEIHAMLFPYNLEEILKKLSPDCEDLLTRCMWRGKIEDCSNLFHLHKTSEGFCCTFNYIRDSDNFIANQNVSKKVIQTNSEPKVGLDVVLDPLLDDYLYTRMHSTGFKVMIFNPMDFPDVPSGGCLEHMVIPSSEQFTILDATLVTASKDVQNLPQEMRGCYVQHDNRMYGSYSDCVVSCRIKSVLSSCECIPFIWPSNNLTGPCSLIDNECLKKWNRAWDNAWSGQDQPLESGETVDETGPPCAYCVPACSDTSYRARRYSIPLNTIELNNRTDKGPLLNRFGIVYKDHSILHIFFEKDSFVHLSNDIFFTWYDWMGFLGGLCGLVMGCSFLTVAEFLYFLIFDGPPETDQALSNVNAESDEELNANSLYWNEIGN